jgi:hypothetical protein
MKPIGQTFFVNKDGSAQSKFTVPGVYITRVDVYFKSISDNAGVNLEIRTTDNGAPTSNRLPFALKSLDLDDKHANGSLIIIASDDASKPTIFEFDTPIFVENLKSYAIVVYPDGGNDEYNIWTAEIGQNDVNTGNPIFTNNDTGDLYLSSNDRSWLPVNNEDMKFNIYVADFTASSGEAVFTTPHEDWIIYKDTIGKFAMREKVVFSNNYFNIAVLGVTGISGTYNTGDTVWQNNGSANVVGIIYSANTTEWKLSNTTGSFVVTSGSSPKLFNATTGGNTSVTAVSQNVSVTSSSNTVSLPDSSIFTVGNVLFFTKANGANAQVVQVTAKPSNTTINVNNAINYTDSSAQVGRVMTDGDLYGGYSGAIEYNNLQYGVLDDMSANSSVNLSNMGGYKIIGTQTGAVATLAAGSYDPVYNSLTPHFYTSEPGNTSISWYFRGFANNASYTEDSDYTPVVPHTTNEMVDIPRVAMSRSSEYARLPIGRKGDHSLLLKGELLSSNNFISPVISDVRSDITYTFNIVPRDYELNGFHLTVSNVGTMTTGDTISQASYGNTTTGIIQEANSSYIRVANVNGRFISNTAFTNMNNSNTGFVEVATKYTESANNGYFKVSRYISKNIKLADVQDSEDMRLYMSAYRPANTNFNVYAKILNTLDHTAFTSKDWTQLSEISPTSLLSSRSNQTDMVELIYGFPQSKYLYTQNTVTSNTSNTVYIDSTFGLANNDFVYLLPSNTISSTTNQFNVRQIVYVVNATSFVVDRPPSFNTSNGVVGYIPDIDSTQSAFLYDRNSNIVRYSTNNDVVYDTYIQFAIKIIPTADSTAVIPRAGDVRVLALQV